MEPESAESTHFSHRGPRIKDGLETDLVHDLDLKAFEKHIEQLFKWHDQPSAREEFRAPYFAHVQSSGMGKTKSFIEFHKKIQLKRTEECVQGDLDAKLDERKEKQF